MSAGALILVPNTLDLGAPEATPIEDVLASGVLRRAAALGHWVAEDAKSARAFLKRVHAVEPLHQAIQAIDIRELPRPAKGANVQPAPAELASLLAPALAGHDVGLISDAGLPAVADPGAALVALAHRCGIAVLPLAGPSALLLALAASGLNGQSFAFVGYLPTDAAARAARLTALQQQSRRERQTQIAIETPYRNAALMTALLESLHPQTQLSVACGLTLPGGWCATQSVAHWRATHSPSFASSRHHPAVFLWLAA